ncbi:MAG TPA: PAS domain S-box protein, partial [Gammaproteobacteria bacterium]|nr:PAS domain S-box protein [Gammaproteobacteria bacterium]
YTDSVRQERDRLDAMVQKRTAELLRTLQELQSGYIEIERAHQEWEQAFDALGELVFLHDEQGRIQRVNKAYATRAGLDYAEILNRPYWEVFPNSEICIGGFHNLPDSSEDEDIRLKNGEVYRSKVYVVRNGDGSFRYSLRILTNITERIQLDKQLNLLLQAVEYSNASVVITDLAGNIQFVNQRFEQVTGYSREEVYGKSPRILKSGETASDVYASMWQTITAGKEWKGEFHNRKKNGTLFWESATVTPIVDERDKIAGYMAIKEDINHQKLAQEAMRRSQKMEALGHLTGGIAHDFNNLLGIIIGNLDFLRRLVRDDERALNRVETASKATLRGAALTKQLLSFSSRQAMKRDAVDTNRVVREMQDLLARSLNPEVELQTALDESLWITDIDPGELEDALLNLALNAKAAMPNGGRLTIATANIYLDDYYAHFHADVDPGDYVELTVSDTGCGMSREVQEHAFEPFYSTRPKGEGTGLD